MDQNVSAQGRPPSEAADPPPAPRGLKIAVIVMGVILIIGFTTVFITIGYRVANPPAATGAGGAGAAFDTEVLIPAGAQVTGTEFRDDRALVTVVDENGSHMVIVLDTDKGRELGRFRLEPE